MRLSIIVPAYNSEKTVAKVIGRLKNVEIKGIKKEIIVVNDASTDKTYQVLKPIKGITLINHKKNTGKGGAVRDGLKNASGDILFIQDDDLEYDPQDIPKVIKPILERKAEIVFGSRNLGGRSSYSSLTYYLGGLFVEFLTNIILGTRLSDSLTGSKAFTRDVYKKISPINSRGFEIESEITAKAIKAGFDVFEIPISYKARTHDQGKNVHWHHAFVILKGLWKYSR